MALAAAVVVPMVLGYVVDSALRTSPLFVFVGLALGIIGAVALVYARYVRRYM
jgi:F0F1-type ATP synthase assembly protein I